MKKHNHSRTKFTLVGPWVRPKWLIKIGLEELSGIATKYSKQEILDLLCQKGIRLQNRLASVKGQEK